MKEKSNNSKYLKYRQKHTFKTTLDFEWKRMLFGSIDGETLATYWKKHNTDYATVDIRLGVKATKEVAFQFMVNNLLNKEYSSRPMSVAAPRTLVKMDVTF